MSGRLLSEAAAAEHVGLPLAIFRAEVEAGNMPAPVRLASMIGKARQRRYFDRVALDRRLDQLSGIKPASGLAGVSWR